MKKPVILSAILLSGLLYNTAKAQVSIHLGFNIPVRHVYVPAPQPVETVYNDDFDDSDDYYYLPDVEAYYSIPTHRYFYNDGGRWVSAAYLPGAYRNYDWRTARRFEVRGRRPYMNHDVYRGRWGGNDNRGDWNHGNRYAGRDFDRGNNGYNNGGRGNWGGQGYPGRDDNQSRGNWGGQGRNDNNQGRGNWGGLGRNDYNQGRGNWGGGQSQPGRNDGGQGRGNWGGQPQQQPSQPSQPSRNDGGQGRGNWGGGQQPNQNGGGRDRGNNGGGGQFAQNQNPRQTGFGRPRF